MAYAELPRVALLRIELSTLEPQRLPAFLGSSLHGALGHALKHSVCVHPERLACEGCPLSSRCLYPALFAPPVPADTQIPGLQDQAPRPLVLTPIDSVDPALGEIVLPVGAGVRFRMSLVGSAIADAAALVPVLQRLATDGMGSPLDDVAPRRRRAALRLDRIVDMDRDRAIFPIEEANPAVVRGVSCAPTQADAVVIRLLTPLRLKNAGHVTAALTPALWLRNLARRANALGTLYGSGPVADEQEVEARARHIEVVSQKLRVVRIRRFSSRQGRAMEWPGVVGELRWRGAMVGELSALLRFGERVQLGKGAALGFGSYSVRFLPSAN